LAQARVKAPECGPELSARKDEALPRGRHALAVLHHELDGGDRVRGPDTEWEDAAVWRAHEYRHSRVRVSACTQEWVKLRHQCLAVSARLQLRLRLLPRLWLLLPRLRRLRLLPRLRRLQLLPRLRLWLQPHLLLLLLQRLRLRLLLLPRLLLLLLPRLQLRLLPWLLLLKLP
jgi:hypothetical protein